MLRCQGVVVAILLAALHGPRCAPAQVFNGWRGNATGLWLEGSPPLAWGRKPQGAMEGLHAQADRPRGGDVGEAVLVEKGLLRDWLIIGPFAVTNSVDELDKDLLAGEADAAPAAGDEVGELAWQAAQTPADDPMEFGTAELPVLDLTKPYGFAHNRIAYACTHLYSPRGGKARVVFQHSHGLKLWLNGREVYRSPERQWVLASYVQLSRIELAHERHPSPSIEVELRRGWNRLLVKLSTPHTGGHETMQLLLRIMDPPVVAYESKNIGWMTELPARSTSTPILVGERIFVLAEPDEILCLDKHSGKILWSQCVNYYEALTPEERKAEPRYAQQIDPLIAQLQRETDRARRLDLRAKLQAAQKEINAEIFSIPADGHFEAHFGIVGFTMPTPVSDGEHVFVWNGMGVAACFKLDGTRVWTTRVRAGELTYGSSPALADGVLATFLNRVYGFDAKTGEILWEQPRVQRNVAALLAAKLAGHNVFLTQRGEVLRPRDGALLFRPRGAASPGDAGWSPPVVMGDTLYLPKYGVTNLEIYDFSKVDGASDKWEPQHVATLETPPEVNRKPDGGWIDRWTAGSPLVHDGIVYQADIWQWAYALDVKERRMIYRAETGLAGYMHYNAVPIAASPTLAGGHVLISDNQGTTLAIKPGRTFDVVHRNHIGTVLLRDHPLPAQETLAYAPPLVDGDRIYLRGERYLYCVQKE
jgi:outer membrane protein assembly factor BamB